MKLIASLRELNELSAVAVIINCNTHWVSTLALVSTLRSVDFPVVLINCGHMPEAYQHFAEVAAAWQLDFYYCDLPLRKHGKTLDRVFTELTADYVLLVDSDVEVLDRNVVDKMLGELHKSPTLYGCGLLHGPEGMDERHGFLKNSVVYQQRMWIPFVLLRVRAVCDALHNRQSFSQFRKYNELASWPTLSHLLAVRFWLPLRKLLCVSTLRFGALVNTPIAEYDTGAALHQYLLQNGSDFKVFPELERGIVHLHGATRAKRRPLWKQALSWLGLPISDNTVAAADLGDLLVRQRLGKYKLSVAEGGRCTAARPMV